MTTYDPNHLREAAQYLAEQDLTVAAHTLRTKADQLQKAKIEDQINYNIGSHFRELVKQRNGWSFNAVSDADIRGFGKAAREAVEKHGSKSTTSASVGYGVGGGGGAATTARSPYPPC